MFAVLLSVFSSLISELCSFFLFSLLLHFQLDFVFYFFFFFFIPPPLSSSILYCSYFFSGSPFLIISSSFFLPIYIRFSFFSSFLSLLFVSNLLFFFSFFLFSCSVLLFLMAFSSGFEFPKLFPFIANCFIPYFYNFSFIFFPYFIFNFFFPFFHCFSPLIFPFSQH